jgi:hypothetical protein
MRRAGWWVSAIVAGLISIGGGAHAAEPMDTVIACAKVRTVPVGLTSAQRGKLDVVVAKLRAGQAAAAREAWAGFVSGYATRANADQVPGLLRWALREGVIETSPALALAADRARFTAEQREELTALLARLRAIRLQTKGPARITDVVLTPAFSKGAPAVASRSTKTLTPAQLDALIAALEAKLQTVGQDSQLATIDLQNALQQQQQVIQMLSNISKLMNDTSMSIIGNLK